LAIKCPTCHADNPDDLEFCGECGTRLAHAVPQPDSLTRTLETPVQPLQKGTLVDRKYRIVEEIGRGGMGVVYKAEDIKLQRSVALKFLPHQWVSDPDARERFIQEARTASALDHPNICNIYEIGETEDGRMYIAMAYYEGESLREKIKRGPLETNEAVDLAIQTASGMAKAHGKGIVHRDIKPANILVTQDALAKVVDFGLAKLAGQVKLTREGTTVGTVAYMSPEQAKGEAVDQRTDVWSLGVVLYEMLAGVLPFKGDREQALIHLILQQEPERLAKFRKDLPPGLEDIVFKALAKKPASRYQTMEEMLGDLRAIAEGLKPLRAASMIFRGRVLGVKKVYAYPALAGTVILAILAALFIFPKHGQAMDSIAVLPFENVNADPSTDYLCDGIAETIINKLSQLSGFKTVINRASAFTYKGKTVDPKKVGQELGVKAVLLTRMVRQGNRLTVSPTLVRAEDGGQLWGERYEPKLEDILSLEENIATSVVQALHLKVTEKDKRTISAREIDNAAAYEYYLKARQEIERGREDALDRAVQYLQGGLALVGDNALLDSAMAYAYSQYVNIGIKPEDYAAKAVEYAKKALVLDPSSAKAYATLGLIEGYFRGNQKETVRYYKKALALDPNEPEALIWLAAIYCQTLGKAPEALALLERAANVDPLNLLVLTVRGAAYYMDGRYDLALKPLAKSYQMDPGNFNTAGGYAMALICNGKIDEASAVIDQMVKSSKDNVMTKSALVYKYAFLKDRTNLFKVMTPDFEETCRADPAASEWIASALALVGEKEKALDWLDNAVNRGFINYPFLAEKDRWLAGIRGEARFKKLLERVKTEWEHFEE
jgi:serine/threonine protein kinase/tetratricopeptide (TPR) repeat protein